MNRCDIHQIQHDGPACPSCDSVRRVRPACWNCGNPNGVYTDGCNDLCHSCYIANRDEYAAENDRSRRI